MNIKHLLLPSPISGAKGTKQGSGLGRTLCLAALFVTFATAAWADVVINSTNFPDGTFRTFVTENFDTEKPKGSLSDAELQAVTTMDVSKKSIQNLKGIEYFTALTSLICYGNRLTQLDVSALTNLVTLECYNNSSVMTTLNATGCTALKTLKCYNSKLEALSLGRCSNLATLDCHSNQLTALNISACVKLTSVSCYGNSIRGDKMVQFINRLPPKTSNTNLNLIYNEDASSGNEIMHAQVLAAKAKK
jgi:Leucine-rich repeat (LRR) protein